MSGACAPGRIEVIMCANNPLKSVQEKIRDENGSLTIFGLFMFVLILMMAGMAVDMMNHETNRTKVQSVVDSAVLAAASSTQTQDAEQVIREYAARAGVDPELLTIDASRVNGVTQANVTADISTGTMFMNIMGVNSLNTPITAHAMETVTKLEISLILDFSSSMRNQKRRETLIDAVDDFVNIVYQIDCSTGVCTEPDPDADITINVVPYGGNVNPGPFMANLMGLQRWHGYSSCGVIPTSSYDDMDLPYGSVVQVPHFYSWWMRNTSANQEYGWCPQDENAILYAANHPQAIKNYIRTLHLNDGTGSQIGFKWGLALLNPSSRDEIKTLAEEGIVTGNTSGDFPADNASNVLKVAVLMTDGGITFQSQPLEYENEFFYDPTVLALRPDVIDPDDYSYQWYYELPETSPFYADRMALLESHGSLEMLDGLLALDNDGNAQYRDRSDIENKLTDAERKAINDNEYISRDQAILDLEAQCAEARKSESFVSVYSIRFLETRQWIEDYMLPCASSLSQYYDVKSVDDLDDAFTSIGKHINNTKLKLVN